LFNYLLSFYLSDLATLTLGLTLSTVPTYNLLTHYQLLHFI